MSEQKYRLEVERDIFTEAQPETTAAEVWQVLIFDAETGELIDSDTGYKTEAMARASGEEWINQHN